MKNKENRVQLYLKEIHQYIIQQIRDEKQWDESVSDREIILYSLVEYEQLKNENEKLKQKLNYIDQNTMITMNLVASMMKEMNLSQHELESCQTYFDSKEYVQSLINNPRNIRPTNKLRQEMNQSKVMPTINDSESTYNDYQMPSLGSTSQLQSEPKQIDQLKIMSDTFDELLKNSGESLNE